ncbi:MAG: hypothetical protein IT297_02585 [Anaerolineae bacterium]|nr:hypothetical protein [Anaerolineae bacterium]MCZ7551940.1 hypothetical protein [Anaerolineales bacterium]
MKSIQSRFPSRQQLLPVFAIFTFFGFSWSLYRMFWYVPSWLEYLSVWKVLTIVAYVLAFALVESLTMSGFVLLFSLFFPGQIFKANYIALGSSLAGLISLAAILIQRKINLVYRLTLRQLAVYPLAFLLGMALFVLVLSWLFWRFPILVRIVNSIAERMTLFAYLYVSLGLVGMLVVIGRNLFGS